MNLFPLESGVVVNLDQVVQIDGSMMYFTGGSVVELSEQDRRDLRELFTLDASQHRAIRREKIRQIAKAAGGARVMVPDLVPGRIR